MKKLKTLSAVLILIFSATMFSGCDREQTMGGIAAAGSLLGGLAAILGVFSSPAPTQVIVQTNVTPVTPPPTVPAESTPTSPKEDAPINTIAKVEPIENSSKPAEKVEPLKSIETQTETSKPYLGAELEDYSIGKTHYVLFKSVDYPLPASNENLEGVYVMAIDGKTVKSLEQFIRILNARKVGDTVHLKFNRNPNTVKYPDEEINIEPAYVKTISGVDYANVTEKKFQYNVDIPVIKYNYSVKEDFPEEDPAVLSFNLNFSNSNVSIVVLEDLSVADYLENFEDTKLNPNLKNIELKKLDDNTFIETGAIVDRRMDYIEKDFVFTDRYDKMWQYGIYYEYSTQTPEFEKQIGQHMIETFRPKLLN